MSSQIITDLEKTTFCGGFTKNQIFDAVISIAIVTLAALQLSGTLPGVIDSHIFTYSAIGLGFFKSVSGMIAMNNDKKDVATLILGLAVVALGITARFDLVSIKDLSITMLAIGAFSTALYFVHKKLTSDHYIKFRLGLNKVVDTTNREEHVNSLFKIVAIGALVIGAMKLCGVLPNSLDGDMLSYITLGVGGATTLFACYKKLVDTEKRHDISEELLAGCALITIGVLGITQHLQALDVAKALVATETAMFAISLLYYLASQNKEVKQRLSDVYHEGLRVNT